MSNHKKKSESCRVQKSVQKIQGYDHESREAAAAATAATAVRRWRRRWRCRAGSRGERRPPQHKFFFAVPTLPMYSRIWRSLFFAFAHFLLYTKDPDLLQALDLPVMPARAGGVAMARWRGVDGGASAYCCSRPKSPWNSHGAGGADGGGIRVAVVPKLSSLILLRRPRSLATTASGNKGFSKPPPRPWPRSTTGPNVKTRQKLRFEKFVILTGYTLRLQQFDKFENKCNDQKQKSTEFGETWLEKWNHIKSGTIHLRFYAILTPPVGSFYYLHTIRQQILPFFPKS